MSFSLEKGHDTPVRRNQFGPVCHSLQIRSGRKIITQVDGRSNLLGPSTLPESQLKFVYLYPNARRDITCHMPSKIFDWFPFVSTCSAAQYFSSIRRGADNSHDPPALNHTDRTWESLIADRCVDCCSRPCRVVIRYNLFFFFFYLKMVEIGFQDRRYV